MKKVTKQQIEEWIENPVTIVFKEASIRERDECADSKGLGAFHAFEPHKTQEILANLNGCVDTWDYIIDALEGEGLWDEEDDRDSSELE